MLWNLKESRGGTRHLFRSICRQILGQPSTRYFDKLENAGNLVLVLDSEGEPICCKFCGFAQVRILLQGGWEMEICSAASLERFLDSRVKLESWAATLPSKVTTVETV